MRDLQRRGGDYNQWLGFNQWISEMSVWFFIIKDAQDIGYEERTYIIGDKRRKYKKFII